MKKITKTTFILSWKDGRKKVFKSADAAANYLGVVRQRIYQLVEKPMKGSPLRIFKAERTITRYTKTEQKNVKYGLPMDFKPRDPKYRRLVVAYGNLLHRCKNDTALMYKYYGGKGVKSEFECIRHFMGWAINNGWYEQPKDTPRGDVLSIDRIDYNGNYNETNCRWIPQNENCRNAMLKTIENGKIGIKTKEFVGGYIQRRMKINETGQEFESIKELADWLRANTRAVKTCSGAVNAAVRNNAKIGGYTFTKLEIIRRDRFGNVKEEK